MSWLFSRALVEGFWQDGCSDGEPCAQLNMTLTAHPFLRNDKTMEPSGFSRFGLTFEVLMDAYGEDLLMWYRADFLVRTSPRLARMQASMVRAPDCGASSNESFARWDRASCSWRTLQTSLFEDSREFSGTWPRWGLMRDGECWGLRTSAERTTGRESGFLPTPLATDWKGGTVTVHSKTGRPRTDQFRHYLKILYGLKYPIPSHTEAVMAWPIGWTDLKPLETGKFQSWQQQHSGFFREE